MRQLLLQSPSIFELMPTEALRAEEGGQQPVVRVWWAPGQDPEAGAAQETETHPVTYVLYEDRLVPAEPFLGRRRLQVERNTDLLELPEGFLRVEDARRMAAAAGLDPEGDLLLRAKVLPVEGSVDPALQLGPEKPMLAAWAGTGGSEPLHRGEQLAVRPLRGLLDSILVDNMVTIDDELAPGGDEGWQVALPFSQAAWAWAEETRRMLQGASQLPEGVELLNIAGRGIETPFSVEYGSKERPVGSKEELVSGIVVQEADPCGPYSTVHQVEDSVRLVRATVQCRSYLGDLYGRGGGWGGPAVFGMQRRVPRLQTDNV